jgi:hypothetical protein
MATSFPLIEGTTIPVQTFQVQQRLRERSVPRLVHPDHTIHAFHGTTGAHR